MTSPQRRAVSRNNLNQAAVKHKTHSAVPVPEYQQSFQMSYDQSASQKAHSHTRHVNERVQVYVRVRPIFNHELVEDMQEL